MRALQAKKLEQGLFLIGSPGVAQIGIRNRHSNMANNPDDELDYLQDYVFPFGVLRELLSQRGFLDVQVAPVAGVHFGYHVRMRQPNGITHFDAAEIRQSIIDTVAQIPLSPTCEVRWRIEVCATAVSGADIDAELAVKWVKQ